MKTNNNQLGLILVLGILGLMIFLFFYKDYAEKRKNSISLTPDKYYITTGFMNESKRDRNQIGYNPEITFNFKAKFVEFDDKYFEFKFIDVIKDEIVMSPYSDYLDDDAIGNHYIYKSFIIKTRGKDLFMGVLDKNSDFWTLYEFRFENKAYLFNKFRSQIN